MIILLTEHQKQGLHCSNPIQIGENCILSLLGMGGFNPAWGVAFGVGVFLAGADFVMPPKQREKFGHALMAIGLFVAMSGAAGLIVGNGPTVSVTRLVSGCAITVQTQPLQVTPMPQQASDSQLASEAHAISLSLFNLQAVNLNEQTKALESATSEKIHIEGIDCETLQEYESRLRIPAEAVQSAILDRLTFEDRLPSQSVQIRQYYKAPQEVEDLGKVAGDLDRLVEIFVKSKGVSARMPQKQWIVPIPKEVTFLPVHYKESGTFIAQEFVGEDLVAQIRWAMLPLPESYTVLVILKSPKQSPGRARVSFDRPLDLMIPWENDNNAVLGSTYIDFKTDHPSQQVCFGTSHDLRITGIRRLNK